MNYDEVRLDQLRGSVINLYDLSNEQVTMLFRLFEVWGWTPPSSVRKDVEETGRRGGW